MAIHSQQTDAEGLHRPKGFDGASNATALIKNESGVLEYRSLDLLGSEGPQGPAGGAARIVVVADIDNPTELTTEVGTTSGELIMARQVFPLADDKFEFYMWDETGTIPDDSPFMIPSTGGGWIKYGVDGKKINYSLSTGVVAGGTLTVGIPNTTFSISDGFGYIVDSYTDPENPTVKKIEWSGLSNIAVDNLASQNITFVSIDENGDVVQQSARWSDAEKKTLIVLGVVVHVNRLNVDTTNNEHNPLIGPAGQVGDLLEGLGFLNLDGNVFSPNGANMSIDKSAGIMMGHGINFYNNPKIPHKLTLAGLTDIFFQYIYSDGSNDATTNIIDPDNLDDGAGGLTPVSVNKWSIQRIYSFTSNNVKIQRGVEEFGSKEAAIAGIATEAFVTEPSIAANGLLRGFIIMQEGTTNLTTQATFIQASKFQTIGGSSTGVATTLQSAYDNSTDPEITTDATRNALSIKQGSGASVQLHEFKDSSDAVKGYIATDEWKVSTQAYSANHDLVDATSIATDCALGNVHTVTLGGNRTLSDPTNMKNGATYIWIIKQDGTGSRTLAYGAAFKFVGGITLPLTTNPNAVDILTGVSDGTNIYCSLILDFK